MGFWRGDRDVVRGNAKFPPEAFVELRVEEWSGSSALPVLLRTRGGFRFSAQAHDAYEEFDEMHHSGEFCKVFLVFNCDGLARIPDSPTDCGMRRDEARPEGFFHFIGRVLRSIEVREFPPGDKNLVLSRMTEDSVLCTAILDAQVPLFAHFWTTKNRTFSPGDRIELQGYLAAAPPGAVTAGDG